MDKKRKPVNFLTGFLNIYATELFLVEKILDLCVWNHFLFKNVCTSLWRLYHTDTFGNVL